MSNDRRTYRQLQADASAEVDAIVAATNGPHACPSCGHTWTGPSNSTENRDAGAERIRAQALTDSARAFAQEVATVLPEGIYGVWLGPCQLIGGTRTTVDIAAPTETAGWIRDRLQPILDRAASQLAGTGIRARVLNGTVDQVPTFAELWPAGRLGGQPDRPQPENLSTTTDRT